MESSITKLARVTRKAIYAVTATALIGSVCLWFAATIVAPSLIDASFPVEVSTPMSIERSLWGLMPAMLPVIQFSLIFGTIAKLFGLYANQVIFEVQNAKLIKRVGVLLLLSPLVTVVSDLLLSIALTYGNGEWSVSIHPSDSDVINFIIGLVVFCVSRVMELAAKINEENKLTI